jgi:hypothetical protein
MSAYIIGRQQIFLSVSKYYLSSANILERQHIFWSFVAKCLKRYVIAKTKWVELLSDVIWWCKMCSLEMHKIITNCPTRRIQRIWRFYLFGYGSATKRPKTIKRAGDRWLSIYYSEYRILYSIVCYIGCHCQQKFVIVSNNYFLSAIIICCQQ